MERKSYIVKVQAGERVADIEVGYMGNLGDEERIQEGMKEHALKIAEERLQTSKDNIKVLDIKEVENDYLK